MERALYVGGINMRGMIAALLLVSCVAFAPAAHADEFFAVTPSGAAEAMFSGLPKAVVGALSSKCIDTKWTVISSSDTELVCEAPMNFGQSLLGQMLMGNSYSTPPRRFFRFNIAQINDISRVQASGWMELQMAFGQTKRTDFSGPEFHNSIINFMAAAGGKLPPGTTFPNHVMLGIEIENTQLGKYTGLRVTSVVPGSPAALGGIVQGDIVSRIASRRFKNSADYLDATAAATKKPTYDVEVIRGGNSVVLTIARAFRPAYTEVVVPEAIASTALAPVSAPTASMADEVAKLAKLRSEGALTDAEFASAKAKLLGQ